MKFFRSKKSTQQSTVVNSQSEVTEVKKKSHLFIKICLLVLVVCLLIVFALYAFTIFQNARSTSLEDQLSNRAQEFLENQKNDSQSIWHRREGDTSDKLFEPANSTVKSSCFQVIIPFKHTSQKITETPQQCILRAPMISPTGVMVITISPDDNKSLGEDSGVNMRRRDTKNYTQEYSTFEGTSEQYQFTSKDSLITFLRKDGKKIVIAFSNITEEVTPEYFTLTRQIFNNLKILSMPTPTPTPASTPTPLSSPKQTPLPPISPTPTT